LSDEKDQPCVTIYTDGSAVPNNSKGRGGWAAILVFNKRALVVGGFEEKATNNRMEARAVLEGLNVLKRPCMVTICTDSQYVEQMIIGISGGKKHFRSHQDLWKKISNLYHKQLAVRVDRVIGHSDKSPHLHKLCDRFSYLAAVGAYFENYRYESTLKKLMKEKTVRKL
jgi:ribonuclease HI